MPVRVCVGESYTAISHRREIAAVSSIFPIYRNIFIISPCTCVEVPRIDWAGQRRKRERDRIKFGLTEQKECQNIGWRGGNTCENIGPLLPVIVYGMWGSLSATFLLTDAHAAAQQRPLLRLHKHVIYRSCDAHFHLACVSRCVSLSSLNLHTRAPIIIIILFPNC